MTSIKSFPQTERPRERLFKFGPKSLSNSELLAIILGKGTQNKNAITLSSEILSHYSIDKLATESINSLKKIKGVGLAKAAQVVSCFELGRRLGSYTKFVTPAIRQAQDVFRLLKPELNGKKKEHFIGLFLDTKKYLIKQETLFIGTLDSTLIHPREIFKTAIKESASSVIVAHNHPTQDSTPSTEDIIVTKQLIAVGKIIGIPLLDHVIIGKDYYSFREKENLF